MTLLLNTITTIPSGPSTAYTVTRPAGCVPATASLTTAQIAFDYLDIGALTAVPKGVNLRVTPLPAVGGHVGLVFNAFGEQVVSPQVFGSGVNLWTHGNGLYFDHSGSIYAESWKVLPGTTEAGGTWFDASIIGSWIAGHTYQVEALLYSDGHFVFRVLDMGYSTVAQNQPSNIAMSSFFSNNSLASDPLATKRIRAKSANGRTNKVGAFIAGAGSSIIVTPLAIFN